jgi:hypothetical protein
LLYFGIQLSNIEALWFVRTEGFSFFLRNLAAKLSKTFYFSWLFEMPKEKPSSASDK